MSSDGLARLAARSALLKNERRLLVEGLKAFEKKLLESSEGLGCCGSSKTVTLERWEHEESGITGGRTGWLFFNGERLIVRTERFADGWDESEWDDFDLETVKSDWQVLLSTSKILESLLADVSRTLEDEHSVIATANEWLINFVAAEKAVIDAEIRDHFEPHQGMLDSWQKAQKTVESDPEDSIARSSSHLETVLKACLKQLGDAGYETMPVDKLTSRVVKKLRDAGILDEGALQSLTGIGTIFHGIGTIRNSSSTAHGKNDGYSPPGADVAQLINHLSGSGSVFVLKQAEKILKGQC